MSNPSILSAIKKIKSLLTPLEKIQWLKIAGFACGVSVFEIFTASLIVIFAQVLTQPQMGAKYLAKIGVTVALPEGRVVLYMALMVGITYLVKNIFAAFEVFYQNFAIQKMNYNFKNKLLHRYADADYAFYLTRNSSLGIQVVGGDVEQMFSGGMLSIASILSEVIIFTCLIMLIVFMNPSLALVIFSIGFVLGLIVSQGLLPMFYQWGQAFQDAALQSNQNLAQFFHAFKEVVLLGKRETFINSYQEHSLIKSQIHAMQTASNSLPRMVIETMFVVLFVATIAYMCFKHETPAQMIGILGGYLYVGFRLMPGLNRIINQLNIFKYVIPAIERVYKEYNTVGAKQNYLDIPNFVFEKHIKISDLSFSYLHIAKDAVQEINLEIIKGECIGIVGETGSGKSTLVDLILGLLKPYKGSVLIDGVYPVNSYQWHQRIGYVPQSIYLTDNTIEANIAFGERVIDTQRLDLAIDAAQLRDFVANLPAQAKTIVGERGIRLSGGERQRIAIARALYREPEVLIFDEATSALDNETEARLMDTIHAVSQNRTVIMIAHRLTTLKKCDRIVTMGNGHIKNISLYKNLGSK